MEDRCQPADDLVTGITLVGGTLTFTGSAGKDEATISGGVARMTSWKPYDAPTTEYTRRFHAGAVTQVVFRGLGGDDRFENTTDLPSYAYGGSGVDTLLGGGGTDNLYGEAGNDTLDGRGGHDNVFGGADVDTIKGGAGDDYLDGGDHGDQLDGDEGNDVLIGGKGNDILFGDSGDDRYDFNGTGQGNDEIRGTSGNDTLDLRGLGAGVSLDLASTAWQTMAGGQLKLETNAVIEHVWGTDFHDVLRGNALANDLTGGVGNDTLEGRDGNDRLDGDAGNDTLEGGKGNDILYGDVGDDTYVFIGTLLGSDELANDAALTSGTDWLDFSSFGSTVQLNLGLGGWQAVNATNLSLKLTSASAIENVVGSQYDDVLTGNGLNNSLNGQNGDDRLSGGGGDDALLGHGGDDTLEGGTGVSDILNGGSGTDTFAFAGLNLGRDRIEDPGLDSTLDFTNFGRGVTLDLNFGGLMIVAEGDLQLDLVAAIDEVYGSQQDDVIVGANHDLYGQGGNDRLYGGSGDDFLSGGNGNDQLSGRGGDDFLTGGSGHDGLFGGSGSNTLRGGGNSDRFLTFTGLPEEFFGTDTILDATSADARITFENGTGDTTTFFGDTQTWSGGFWSEAEVERIDQAFAVLIAKTSAPRLLKQSDGSGMNFIRQGSQTNETDFKPGAWNSGGTITMIDRSFDRSEERLFSLLLHEIAHNWDEPSENSFVNEFRALSGWTPEDPDNPFLYVEAENDVGWWYLGGANFVSEYARSAPEEDFADTLTAYVMRDDWPERDGFRHIDECPDKKAVLTQWLIGLVE